VTAKAGFTDNPKITFIFTELILEEKGLRGKLLLYFDEGDGVRVLELGIGRIGLADFGFEGLLLLEKGLNFCFELIDRLINI
jgi:hypothetical protein